MDANIIASTVAAHGVAGVLDNLNGLLDKADHVLTSPLLMHLVSWGVSLLGLGGGLKWIKNRSVQKFAHLAFMAVEEADRRDPNATLDKAALFAEHFEAFMKRAGWFILTDADMNQAQGIADALNVAYENARFYAGKGGPDNGGGDQAATAAAATGAPAVQPTKS